MTCRVNSASQHLGSSTVRASPDGDHIAYVGSTTSKLLITHAASWKIAHIFPCVDKIDRVEWSPSSEHVLCAMFSRCAVQVFSLSDRDWTCRIDEGMGGIVNVQWCPDCAHVLIESDFGLQISVWSLTDKQSYVFTYPKPSSIGSTIVAFDDSGSFMAIGHRIDLQDYIGVYSTHPWTELCKFRCRSNDLAHVHFVPGSTNILTIDSALCYRMNVYSPSGDHISSFEPYQNALGVRSLAFQKRAAPFKQSSSPFDSSFPASDMLSSADDTLSTVQPRGNASLLALGSFDGKVRVLSPRSWELAYVLPLIHTKELANVHAVTCTVKTTVEVEEGRAQQGTTVFESDLWGSTFDGDSSILSQSVTLSSTAAAGATYVNRNLKSLPRLNSSEVRAVNGPPKAGVSSVLWAPGSSLLVAREESHPRCIWVWNALDASLVALLVQAHPVLCASWRPKSSKPILAFCTGSERVYIWSDMGPSWVHNLPFLPIIYFILVT